MAVANGSLRSLLIPRRRSFTVNATIGCPPLERTASSVLRRLPCWRIGCAKTGTNPIWLKASKRGRQQPLSKDMKALQTEFVAANQANSRKLLIVLHGLGDSSA